MHAIGNDHGSGHLALGGFGRVRPQHPLLAEQAVGYRLDALGNLGRDRLFLGAHAADFRCRNAQLEGGTSGATSPCHEVLEGLHASIVSYFETMCNKVVSLYAMRMIACRKAAWH